MASKWGISTLVLVAIHLQLCRCRVMRGTEAAVVEEGQTTAMVATRRPDTVKGKKGPGKLKDDERCQDDITDFCSKLPKPGGNFELLICLQDQIKDDELSEECHAAVWEYKSKVVNDIGFETPIRSFCEEDLKKIPDCKGMQPGVGDILPCLVENLDHVTNTRCKNMLNKVAQVLFDDYRLLKHFYKDCEADVTNLECGRIDVKEKDDKHTQGSTIECLEDYLANLTSACRLRVLRVAELQSEDYHLNKALYYACRDDRERLCPDVKSGKGRVYNCLMKKKFDEKMSQGCKQKLTKKQKVESKDYKANFPFLESCKVEIEKHNCKLTGTSPSQLAAVLLCLENAVNDGNKLGGTCRAHMKDLQEQLMLDFSLNPAIVAHCQNEIRMYCGKVEKGGKTLDCLMEKAMDKDDPKSKIQFGQQCYDAVNELLKETGAGGDFKMDATLYETCRLTADQLCTSSSGDVNVLSCLFEHLHHRSMARDCQEQLMHLQFFLARDFKLDQALYRVCKADAERICGATDPKDESKPHGLVLACLYRHTIESKYSNGEKVNKACATEVLRTMHERAEDVKMMPEIQESCLKDLSQFCSDKLESGEEIKCLQDNLEKLTVDCKSAISEFTEEEAEDLDIDKSLIKHCADSVEELCKESVENNRVDDILPCLYRHKFDKNMDVKCRAELEHRQLIELKDFKFSAKFRQSCQTDVKENCPDATTKQSVIECLSGIVRDAVIGEKDHVVSDECRAQLRVEKMRQAEDIKLDTKLYGPCEEDVKKHCARADREKGPAAVLECLKRKQDKLSDECRRNVLKREDNEVKDAELDVRLFRVCKTMIKKFCADVSPNNILNCLKKHQREMDTDEKCKEVVFTRLKNQIEAPQLNPDLSEACKNDVTKFCHNIKNNDQIIPCLKKHLQKLSESCEEYIAEIEEEAALDYRLNPSLAKMCETEIKTLCSDKKPGHGEVMECLKDNYRKIKNPKCKFEVKEALIEERTDIMADPVLHEACITTVEKHCDDVQHGRGRILQCLLTLLDDGKIKPKECKNVLKARKQMWNIAEVPPPESLSEFMSIVGDSPSRNYFFIVFSCVLLVIFVGGIVSGRLSKRVARDAKNR